MKINWSISLNSIPELADLPKKERKRLWRQCVTCGFRHWQTRFALIGTFLWIISINILSIYLPGMFPNANKYLLWILESILGFGLGLYFFNIVLISMVRPYIRAQRK